MNNQEDQPQENQQELNELQTELVTGGGTLGSVLKNMLKCLGCGPHHPTPPKSSQKQLRWVDPSGETRVKRSDSILTPIPEEEHSNHSHPIE
jgi:hypothetical protein